MTLARPLVLTAALAVAGCSASAPMAPATDAPPADGPAPTDIVQDVPLMFEDEIVPADHLATAREYAATITPQELAGLLYTYSDDFLRGRDTGEPGQRFAATFLAGQYAAMGVAPRGRGIADTTYALEPYLQPFQLERRATSGVRFSASVGGEQVLTVALPGDGVVPMVPVFGTVPDVEDAPVVFVGDGSALDGVDLAGAFALAVPATQGEVQSLAGTLLDAGAASVLMPLAPTADPFQRFVGGATRERLGMMSDDDPRGALILMGQDTAEALLGGPLAEATVGPTRATMSSSADATVDAVDTENVIAFVEGSDLADEVVVISAHLDHVGDDGEGEDAIYNGADDDGSGTVAMLEIAEAFQRAKDAGDGPRRSILFLHVTGEEKGLFGSAYYTDRDPVVPIENTVANLNIDMIGRYDPERGFETTDYVYIIGGDLISQDLHDWNAAANTAMGTDLLLSDRFNSPDDPNQFFRRSDHWNFGKYDVPFIFYFTGTHEDYHGVGDEARKIDYDRLARISRLIFGTAWDLATRDERPQVSGAGFN